MPKLDGPFTHFTRLDEVSSANIAGWLGRKIDPQILENKLGNVLLYPQGVSVSVEDLSFHLAILREVIKLHRSEYYNSNQKKIFIPGNLIDYFPNLPQLAWAFADVLAPMGITSLLLRTVNVGMKNLGSVIKPEIISPGVFTLTLIVEGKTHEIKTGGLQVIPAAGNKVDINFCSTAATLLGKTNLSTEIMGGKAGVLVDARGNHHG